MVHLAFIVNNLLVVDKYKLNTGKEVVYWSSLLNFY